MTTAANLAALGNGPTFFAKLSGNQTISQNTTTKLQLSVENWDTNSNYDTSAYRFTPTVAGYYQITLNVRWNCSGGTNRNIFANAQVQKNGAGGLNGYYSANTTGSANEQQAIAAGILYMNGSTDYLETTFYHYDYTGSAATVVINDNSATYFTAALVRGA